MKEFYYFILIISFLAAFGCLLAVRLIHSPTSTVKLQHLNFDAFVINCTSSTCTLMQQTQNIIIGAAKSAIGLCCSIHPISHILQSATTLGSKMPSTRHRFVNYHTGIRDTLCFVRDSKIFFTSITN